MDSALLPKAEEMVIESRHLGLVTPDEVRGLSERLTKLAALQRAGDGNSAARKDITDAYRPFMKANQDALCADKGGGVRVGNLKVWIAVKRELHAEIVD